MVQRIILAGLIAAAVIVGLLTMLPLGVSRFFPGFICGGLAGSSIALFARPLTRRARPSTDTFRRAQIQLGSGRIGRQDAHNGSPDVPDRVCFVNPATEDATTRHDPNSSGKADLAHQLRTVLQLLTARIDRLETSVTEERSAIFAKVRADLARLRDILTEQLDDPTGRATTPPTAIDVRKVVMDRLNAWSDEAARRGSLTLRPMTIDSAVIVTQRGTLEHLLDILFDNATKYSPAHCEILVSAQVSPTGEQVAVRVVDQGPGITATQREHALERGWRADSGDIPGRGLGLSIAEMLVKSNQGRLTLDAASSGHGLEVSIYFPVVFDRRTSESPPHSNDATGTPYSITLDLRSI
ncbi:sensor histidine kinase [Nocardia asteroides]|uniref:sensor histidine kinase n=1 Tax=Nocardia asteroides TaxID=1824 RepID=UPI001E46D19C|nr:ATP-binding protein [Nocardia asteroides]UGT60372.1 HAMP domain-containing histidine kinase [Nocardia asteroides]